jgi:hypothetical protein
VKAGPTRQAEKAGDAAKQSSKGLVKDLFSARERLLERGVSPGDIALKCGLVGVTLGFLFQITHNVGYLPVYDVWAFKLGPFPEAWTIPLLLAPIWLLYGYLAPITDEYVNDSDVASAQERTSSLPFVLLCWVFLAAQFLLSDALYQYGQPHWVCHAVLSVLAAAIWKKFDGTKDGAVLAALLTVGAPVGEMLIVNFLGLWHYERPELFGVPAWAGWCYATYAIGVANVARYFVTRQEQR